LLEDIALHPELGVLGAEPLQLCLIGSPERAVAHEVTRRVLLSPGQANHELPASNKSRATLARRAVRVGRLVDSAHPRTRDRAAAYRLADPGPMRRYTCFRWTSVGGADRHAQAASSSLQS